MTPTNASTTTVAFRLPDLGEGVVDTEIIRWLVAEGDTVVEDQPMVEVMTDKATVEIPSPASGTVLTLHAAAGTTVAVGSVIVEIAGDGTSSVSNSRPINAPGVGGAAAPVSARVAAAAERAQGTLGEPAGSAPGAPLERDGASGGRPRPGRVQATPLVRKRAAELGVDLAQVTGTGPNGRITEADLVAASAGAAGTSPLAAAAGGVPAKAPAQARVGVRKTELLAGMRRAIADHLSKAQQVPTVTVVEECELTAVEAARREAGVGFLPYVIRAVARGFVEVPAMNAHLDEVEREIVQYERIDIGIAVQTDAGLVVPVLRDATAGSLGELETRIGVLADGAKNSTLTPAELRGGTFTVTSAGKLGGLFTTPLLNVPEVGILGLHRAEDRAVVRDGEIVIRRMANLSVTFDHRALDGIEASRFLLAVIGALQDPASLQ